MSDPAIQGAARAEPGAHSRAGVIPRTRPNFVELYQPKLITVLAEGYRPEHLRRDAAAGLTVAIVALPLSMAISIACGLPPGPGLAAAIVGGAIVSALGGSRFQIGGPAGAFIGLVGATFATHGVDGLMLATAMSGVFLLIGGLLRVGAYIRLIPYPATVGFTAGIALIIFASQIRDLFGLTIEGPAHPDFLASVTAAAGAIGSFNPAAAGIAGFTAATILGLQRWRPQLPSILIAVVLAAVAAAALGLPVETVGSRFGAVPAGLPAPRLPDFTLEKALAVLPDAFAFALLGAIESLLSASVADGMSGRRSRANCELVAQGVANIAAPLFGGMPVTGKIARTATNVRAGAHGPVAGLLHAIFILVFSSRVRSLRACRSPRSPACSPSSPSA